jgi:hypothetical protein
MSSRLVGLITRHWFESSSATKKASQKCEVLFIYIDKVLAEFVDYTLKRKYTDDISNLNRDSNIIIYSLRNQYKKQKV